MLSITRNIIRKLKKALSSYADKNFRDLYKGTIFFDEQWYLSKNPDVEKTDAYRHYAEHGWKEGRDPSIWFSVSAYLTHYPDVRESNIEPLQHYLSVGIQEDRCPNPAFHPGWYRQKYMGNDNSIDPFLHFQTIGAKNNHWPHPLLDIDCVRETQRLSADTDGFAVLKHYLTLQGRGKANAYFDGDFYLRENPDVRQAGLHPLRHYFLYANIENRNPSEFFDSRWYLTSNADVRIARMNPLEHYIHFGRAEGRLPLSQKEVHGSNKEAYIRLLINRLSTFFLNNETISFESHDTYDISIIIVLYNKAFFTLRCLESLAIAAASNHSIRLQLIVFDNASSDQTSKLMKQIKGIKYVQSPNNVGFLRAVNQASEHATGQYLLLLNNDTEVFAGSLQAALNCIKSNEKIGAVGARLVAPNGLLQEAGSIIYSDGSCEGYARDAAPMAGHAMFRRAVDYCSGAFLLTPTALFRKLGKLDDDYAPAYYEEADYCCRLSQLGYLIIYEPSVMINHFEFGSAETSDWAIKLQEKNREKFKEKNKAFLRGKQTRSEDNYLIARSAFNVKNNRVLIIDDRVPHEWLGSGFPRAKCIVRWLAERTDFTGLVTLLCAGFDKSEWSEIRETLPATVEVLVSRDADEFQNIVASRWGQYGTVFVSRPHNMSKLKATIESCDLDWSASKVIYDAEAIFAVRDQLRAELTGNPLPAKEYEARLAQEMALAARASVISAVSEDEANAIRKLVPGKVFVLGHAINTRRQVLKSDFSKRRNFVFVGTLHSDDSPNADSLFWFIQKIWKNVEKALPGVKLLTAGMNNATQLSKLASESVEFLGKIPDLDELYASSRVFIVPTRYAAGIPHKAHEAAAAGIPMVTTRLIAGQLGWRDELELLSADDEEKFAQHCIDLYSDEKKWQKIQQNALKAVQRDCDPSKFYSTLTKMLDSGVELGSKCPGSVLVRQI